MSVDKGKDTSPKNQSLRTRWSKPSRNPLPRLKTNRTLHQKSKVWARVRSQYPKPTRTTGTTFLGKRKSDSTCHLLHGGTYAAAAVLVWSFAGGVGRGCQCLYTSRQVHLGPVHSDTMHLHSIQR